MALFSGGIEVINAGTLLVGGIPTATVVPWTDSSVPTGFLECNGSAVSRSTYSALFAVIGTTYGAGNGSTTFNLPDLQDEVVVGKSGTKALASTGGANTVASSGSVSGTIGDTALTIAQLPAHTHNPVTITSSVPGSDNPTGSGGLETATVTPGSNLTGTTSSTGSGDTHTHSFSGTFSGSATSVVQPYLALIYIIKT